MGAWRHPPVGAAPNPPGVLPPGALRESADDGNQATSTARRLAQRHADPGGTADGLRAFRPGAGGCCHPCRKSRGGKAGSPGDAACRSRRDRPGATPRPRRSAGNPSRVKDSAAGADQVRPDAGHPVHLLPRCSPADGGRSRRDAALGLDGAAVRGCAPEQLRRVRDTGTPADLRHQRLRRDLSRTVRVGRQAAGGQRRGGRAGRRLPAEEGKGGSARGRGRLPDGDPPVGPDGQPRRLVLPPGHGRPAQADPQAGRPGGRSSSSGPAWPRPASGTATTRCASCASPSTVRCRSRTTRR